MAVRNRGNAFFITLISVVLLGAITFFVTRHMGGTTAQGIGMEKTDLYADQIINYAASASSVIQQMMDTGATYDTLNFDLPSDGTYDSGTTRLKVYHPAGGGLRPFGTIPTEMGDGAFNRFKVGLDDIGWTPTTGTGNDVVFTVYSLSQSVCAGINNRLTGSATIPNWNGSFEDFGNSGAEMNATNCSGCEGKPMLCAYDTGTSIYGFYAILYAN